MIWTGIGIVCFMVLLAVGLMHSTRFKALRHVYGRVKLGADEFAEKYFPEEQREIASKVRHLLAPYLTVSSASIRPNDRLIDDLGLSERLSCGLDEVEFVHDLEDEFKIEFGEDDYLQMQTFRDAVDIVEEKLNKSGVEEPE